MNKEDINLLYSYNAWANARILKAASGVTANQFLAPASFPHGGLRSTLTHILFAEWVWRKRWEGESPTSLIEPEEFPTFVSLQGRWLTEEKALLTFVEKITNDRLNGALDYKSTKGDPTQNILWQLNLTHTDFFPFH